MGVSKKVKVLGAGLVAACAVCLVPLAVPVVLAMGGLGLAGAGYLSVGAVIVLGAGTLWWRRSRARACG